MITNDTLEHVQIHNAIKSPKLVLFSDRFHQTLETLRKIVMDADIDILYVQIWNVN